MGAVAVFVVGFMCGAAVAIWACLRKIDSLERQVYDATVRRGAFADWAAKVRKDGNNGKEI